MNPNELEEKCLKHFDSKTRHPLSEGDMLLLLQLYDAELHTPEKVDQMFEAMIEDDGGWVLKTIQKRVDVRLSITVSKAVLIMLLYMNKGAIGRCVLYLYYLQYWAKKNNTKEITMLVFCNGIFPDGFISEKDFKDLYYLQKVKQGNLMDYQEAAQSIMF